VLVVAPKRVVENVWHAEIANWSHLRGLTYSRVIGTEPQRRHALNKPADVYLVSRDNVAWLVGFYGGKRVPFDMLVIDESSSFKNPKAVRFKALKQVLDSFARVVILTGTPAPNGLEDLWSQIYLLDRGKRLGKYISHYREDYFRKGFGQFSKFEIREGAHARISERIGDIVLSMKAADYLDLPGRVNNFINVDFPPALRKKYDDFAREHVLEALSAAGESGEISAANAAALTNKLLQFANGAVYDENRNVHEIHALKLDVLEEIIEGAQGRPVLVAYTFIHDLNRILARFKKYGPRHIKEKGIVDAWNAGEVPILLMHPASGGHGLNLQKGGSLAVWFGQTWSLELYQQFNARLDRQGQTDVVVINHIVAPGTIDDDVVKAQGRKEADQDALMTSVKALIARYT